ncbi:MAG: hypothetical protein WBA51_01565 [Erythrobacter sp.]
MTNTSSMKIRAIGGASVIALSAGFSVSAYAAPQPVPAVPTPAVPAAPANAEECTLITTTMPPSVVCAPGTDADGFDEPFNSIGLVVEAGSQVQGEIGLLVNADVTVDGDIVSSTGIGVDVLAASTVVNNGLVTNTTSGLAGIIRAGDGSTVTNNGVITSTQDNNGAIEVRNNSVVVNNGEISFSGSNIGGITAGGSQGFGFQDGDGVTVTNSITGSILVGTTGVGSVGGILLGDDATVVNDGLIQTFGNFAEGIDVLDSGNITNNGFVFTTGDNSTGVDTGANATIVNSGAGRIFTFGDNANGITAGADSFVQNNGIISADGAGAEAVLINGDGTVNNNPTGQIVTDGDAASAIEIAGNGTLVNAGGLIQAFGADSDGVRIGGDATIGNSGTITSSDGDGINISGTATITNFQAGVIQSDGDDAIDIDGDGATVTNFGFIVSNGDAAIEANSAENLTVINHGTIRAVDKGIESEDNLTVVNTGLIISTADEAIEAEAGGLNLTNSGQIISPFDDAVDGDDNVIIVNSGLIQGGENDGLELNSGSITNSGTIESLSSDPNGSLIIGDTVPELDAAIDFDAGTDGNEDGTVMNLAGGVIVGDIGINTSQGNQDSPDTNDGAQIVTNFGTITGRGANPANGGRADAVLLGNGDDIFIQVNDGVQNGWVDGQAGNDVFAFIVTDQTDRTFDLGGTIAGFENIRIGSQTFDFVTGMLGTTPATGVITLTGTGNDAVTIVNTAILDGTINGAVDLIVGADDGIDSGTFTITENGAIATTADGDVGFTGGDGTTLNNGGSVTTTGMATAGVLLGEDSALNNTGSVRSEGTNGVGVVVGSGSTITNAAGATITTSGDNGFGVIVTGDGTLNNNGIVAVSGASAQAVTITGAAQITNDGTIAAAGGRAIDVALASTISNTENGTIASAGGDAIRMNAAGSTTSNAGTISTTANGGIGVLGSTDSTVNNSGSITTEGDSTAAILLGANATVNTQGTIRSTGTNGVAIALGNNANLLNTGTGTITTTGDNGFGVVINGNGTVNNESIIAVSGAGAQALTITGEALVINSGTIAAADGRAVDVALASTIANTGTIASSGTEAIRMNAEGSTTSNAGTIATDSDGGIAVRGSSASTVNNSGSITTSGMNTAAVLLGAGGTVNNQGDIGSTGTQGVAIVLGDGGTLLNAGMGAITSTGDNGPTIVITGDGTITNEASISATGADAQAITVTGDATITNSGSITGADGRAIDVAGVATIENAMGGTITSTTRDAIRFNLGSTLTNRGTVSGATVGISGSGEGDTVVNFGTIEGGVALAGGSDEFQQWTGASITGDVDLGGGDDLFILEGTSSSVTGTILGGMGSDTAILAGVLDSDNLGGIETVQLGSTLGGTLNDLDISGNRSITGDVVHVGIVNVGLGVDSLTTTGSITLESTGVLNIATPLDAALIGQSVLVLQDGTGFTNNGATINILDDDLFLEYTPIVGSLRVQVNVANPLAGSADPNLSRIGNAVTFGVIGGTISDANFAILNALPDANALTAALTDALPSLSDGVGREIFESGSVASQALNRHLAGEESGVWGQIAVRGAEQDALSLSADGYDSDQLIFTAGGDVALGDDTRVGLMVSYADIDVQDESATGARGVNSDVESLRLGVYAGVTLFERGFLNTEFSYLTGEVDTAITGALGAIGSNYDFDGFATRTTLGYDLLPDENISITPTIGLNAARINFDDALETGGFGFTVERGDAAFVELRAGAEFGAQVSEKVSGFIGGTLIRDLIDDPRSFRLSSAQLPTFALDLPLREQDRFELAAGASVDVSENFVVELGYIGDFNSGYNAHSARASVRVAF